MGRGRGPVPRFARYCGTEPSRASEWVDHRPRCSPSPSGRRLGLGRTPVPGSRSFAGQTLREPQGVFSASGPLLPAGEGRDEGGRQSRVHASSRDGPSRASGWVQCEGVPFLRLYSFVACPSPLAGEGQGRKPRTGINLHNDGNRSRNERAIASSPSTCIRPDAIASS